MNVNFDGRTYSFEVRPGPDGYKQFTEAIRKAFNLPDDSELNITFTCDEPVAVPETPLTAPMPTTPGLFHFISPSIDSPCALDSGSGKFRWLNCGRPSQPSFLLSSDACPQA